MKYISQRNVVCSTCLTPTLGKLCIDQNSVYLIKSCAANPACNDGQETRSLFSSDSAYFLRSRIPSNQTYQSKRLGTLIIEVTDDCNMRCPTCIAGSQPGAGNYKSLDMIGKMIAAAESLVERPDILMISGGEPTIHPDIIGILSLACHSSIDHVMLITNGKRLAEDLNFAGALEQFRGKLEIYLQFDSLNENVLREIRGEDLSDIRIRAISQLQKHHIAATLICVVKKGLNDGLCADVIKYALQFENIRGVTFQPIKASGRTESLRGKDEFVDLAYVRNIIGNANVGFKEDDLLPHPLNTENICIGYLRRDGDSLKPVTSELFRGTSATNNVNDCLYFLPKHNRLDFCYENLFRVTIISFLDKYNFSQEALSHSVIGFILPQGNTIPLDSYYMNGRSL